MFVLSSCSVKVMYYSNGLPLLKFLVKIQAESDNISKLHASQIRVLPKLRKLDSNTRFPVMCYITPAKDLASRGIMFLITKNMVEIEDDQTKVTDT